MNMKINSEDAIPNETISEWQGMNFNPHTGKKLNDTCTKCWVKNNKPYNCGSKKCIGKKLIINEIRQTIHSK